MENLFIYPTSTINQYGKREFRYCKRTNMGMDDYILEGVVLVPTAKASRYDLLDGKWIKSNPT